VATRTVSSEEHSIVPWNVREGKEKARRTPASGIPPKFSFTPSIPTRADVSIEAPDLDKISNLDFAIFAEDIHTYKVFPRQDGYFDVYAGIPGS
jgi:hypothetical protein